MNKEKIYYYLILSFRWYLAFYMLNYGYGKMFGGQFHVKPEILNQPLKSVDSFYVAWHLFSRSSFFNISIGLTQCFGAILIVINRTKLIGAFVLLPVLINIFIIDVAFTTKMLSYGLPIRLFGMIICDFMILYYYKKPVISSIKILTQKLKSDKIEKWWVYPILFIVGFLMDFILGIALIPIQFLLTHIFHN